MTTCSVSAQADAAVVLVVRTDGRIVDVPAGDPAQLRQDLDARELSGRFLSDVWPDDAAAPLRQRIRDASRRRTVSSLEISVDDGYDLRTHEVTILPHGRDRALVICRDATSRVSQEREVRDLAYRDPLTQLPNRAAFLRDVSRRIDEARLVGRTMSLIRIHLRGLDYINRTFGRRAGSQVVVALAQRLAQAIDGDQGLTRHLPAGASLLLARTEGNEYSVLVDGTAQTDVIRSLAEDTLARLTQSQTLGSEEVSLDVSMGVARFPQDANDLEVLLANAGVALYDARKHTASAIEFFSSTAQVRSLSRMDIATELRWALDNDQFHIVYQPWFDMNANSATGTEALLRWEHPLRGQVPLSEILPIAQMNDLCDALGDWVLEHAVRDLATGQANLGHGDTSSVVSVNLFARQSFSPHLVERARRIVDHYDVSPDRLCFEIRAADFLRDMMTAEATARALRDAGFFVALDDCGFEALNPRALLRTGIRQIKLGRRLIRRLPDANAQKVIAAHLGMVQPLGIELCATGVEAQEEFDSLTALGCRYMQGFLLAKPARGLGDALDASTAMAAVA